MESFEPHDSAYKPLVEHFWKSEANQEVIDAYTALVKAMEKNWYRVPPEIMLYHQGKLAEYKWQLRKIRHDAVRRNKRMKSEMRPHDSEEEE